MEACADSQVGSSVVEAVVVDVVYYHFVGRVYDHSVHDDVSLVDPGYGVKNPAVSGCTPFVSDECGVVGWVDEGYFVLG